MLKLSGWSLIVGIVLIVSQAVVAEDNVQEKEFGKIQDGTVANIYTLKNAAGAEARITNYGGVVVSLKMPDRQGKFDDVVLGFDTLDGYLKDSPFFGALVGRYANRIGGAKFTLDGTEYKIPANDAPIVCTAAFTDSIKKSGPRNLLAPRTARLWN